MDRSYEDVCDHLRDWQVLRSEQHGVATRDQLISQGLTDQVIRSNIAAGRWRRVYRGVIALFTGPLTRPALLAAALAYGGPSAILSHRTAAEEWGWFAHDEHAPVHVTVPYTHSAVSCPDVVVHRSRAFACIHHAGTLPPRTSRLDTVLDMAVAEPDSDRAIRTMVETAALAGVGHRRLVGRMEIRRPYRYEKALLRALGQFTDGLCSPLEVRYAFDVERAHGVPLALRQVPVVVDGVTLWEDCTYENVGIPLVVRLDGRAFHTASGVVFRDRRRDNASELAGRPRLVYGWREVTRDPCGVASEVVTVLRREGWSGPVRPCGDCRECFRAL